MDDVIKLSHGSGGEVSRKLVEGMVESYFSNDVIARLDDSAVMALGESGGRIAMTTDSYVVDPIFFPGGDIGSLAVNGTVNDLSMVGASPVGITLGLILEEGLAIADLNRILGSIRDACREAGVPVVGGDTKVVEHGSADRIFINTSGIGLVAAGLDISSSNAKPGDVVILSGTIGDHGIAVLSKREGIDFETDLVSDSAPLNGLVREMLRASGQIHAMRDPTRGGLATTLNEIAAASGIGITIDEGSVPVKEGVSEACELLGLDVFYVANEGKLVAFVPADEAQAVLEAMRGNKYGREAVIIGQVGSDHPGLVTLRTSVGGSRLLSPLSGELLPRIC
ncbi:MAG TPA: hydrogenase expression/formation protein HypE [bacterium]|nr:hydrogenase expression/formation protein HypE [bacterium]